MKTAVIYARYSSDKQTEQSIEGQLRICNDYAGRNDIVVVDTYIDRAMTGTNDNRTAFQKMLKDSNKRAWDIVLVYKLDRFSRNKYEMAMHKKTLRDNGIKVVSAMENIPDTPEGIILESLLEGMAEYYSAELAQKVKRGMYESRIKGNFSGGKVLYGYKVENKKVLINEETASVVRYIFEEYAKGAIAKDIINELHSRGIYKNGRKFVKSTVYDMLANEKYSGIVRHDNEIFTNIYPKLVPDEIFEIVQKRLDANKFGRKSLEVVYLLKNKIKCGYCGKKIIAESGTAKSGKIIRYYKCSGKKSGNPCQKAQVRKEALEEIIVNTTLTAFNDKATLSNLADKILELNEKRIKDETVLNILLKSQKEIEKSIENLLSAIEQGIITNSTKSRLKELEKQQEEINEKITIEQTKLKINISKDEILGYIKTALSQEPKQMLDYLVKEIILYNDKVEIIYNYTNRNNPDDIGNQDYSFYSCYGNMPTINVDESKRIMQKIKVNALI